MKTVLVTGGAGFIGSNLVGQLLVAGYRVACVDNFDDTYDRRFKEEHIAPYREHPHFALYEVDIRDAEALGGVFAKEKPSLVVHLAARAEARNAVLVPRIYLEVNIDGTLNVLELAREYGVENLVLASSSSVYGNLARMPWKEDEAADRQLSPYGATKRAIELIAYTYHHNFGMNITCLRYFNAYGENNRPNMVPYIWTEKLLKGEEIEISGDGSRSRDYTYVGDVARATVLAMERPLGYEILNVGDNAPVSLNELLAMLEKVLGVTAKVKSRPSNKPSVESTYADITKAKRLLGWAPEVKKEEGIARLVAWFRAHRLEKA